MVDRDSVTDMDAYACTLSSAIYLVSNIVLVLPAELLWSSLLAISTEPNVILGYYCKCVCVAVLSAVQVLRKKRHSWVKKCESSLMMNLLG